MLLSDSIKALRTKAFLSQNDFAKEVHVSIATVNRWQHGKTRPNITAMKYLKEFCKDNGLPFDSIEEKWLNYQKENRENG